MSPRLAPHFTAVLAFDATLAAMTPEDFVRRELSERLGVSHVVTGYDFHFGHGRKGTPETMRELGRQLGFGVTVIDQVTDDNGFAPFSSSAIRDSLRHGHVSEAARQLGYWWTVEGEVVQGDRRGRSIGFPTLNIVLPDGSEPFQGIYAVRVRDAATSGFTPLEGAPAISGAGPPSPAKGPFSKSISWASAAISMARRCWSNSST